MTATQALSVPEKIRLRRGTGTGAAGIGSRPGFLTYGLLAAFIIGSVYPLWWSVVVASGTNATRGETLPLIPGATSSPTRQRCSVPFRSGWRWATRFSSPP
jgi:cellobiose transport system permease protein